MYEVPIKTCIFSVTKGGKDEINLGGVIFEQPPKDLPFFDFDSYLTVLTVIWLPFLLFHAKMIVFT